MANRIATGEPASGGATIDPNATPTGTRVVVLGTSTSVAVVTPLPTSVQPTIPDSGGILPPLDRAYLLWAGGGVLFVLLLYGAYSRTKSPPQAPDDDYASDQTATYEKRHPIGMSLFYASSLSACEYLLTAASILL